MMVVFFVNEYEVFGIFGIIDKIKFIFVEVIILL